MVSGNPILVTPQTQADLDAFKGKLAGKIVMISPKRDLEMVTTPLGVRYNDAELQEIESAADPDSGVVRTRRARRTSRERRADAGALPAA